MSAPSAIQAEESRVQRLARQQARIRDRGGIFVPSNTNPLLERLLARTVNGESPGKRSPKKRSATVHSKSKPRPRKSRVGNATSAVTISAKKKASRKSLASNLDEGNEEPEKSKAIESASKPAKRSRKVKFASDADDTQPPKKGRGKPAKPSKTAEVAVKKEAYADPTPNVATKAKATTTRKVKVDPKHPENEEKASGKERIAKPAKVTAKRPKTEPPEAEAAANGDSNDHAIVRVMPGDADSKQKGKKGKALQHDESENEDPIQLDSTSGKLTAKRKVGKDNIDEIAPQTKRRRQTTVKFSQPDIVKERSKKVDRGEISDGLSDSTNTPHMTSKDKKENKGGPIERWIMPNIASKLVRKSKAKKAPRKSVLERIRAVLPKADDDPDPIDFLS